MSDKGSYLAIEVQIRRNMEDQALELGRKRLKLAAEVEANMNIIRRRLPEAIAAGIPVEHYAQMVRVSRQTLHRWREAAAHAGSSEPHTTESQEVGNT